MSVSPEEPGASEAARRCYHRAINRGKRAITPIRLFAGKRPAELGLRNGRLAPCPPRPNCVCSQAEPSDARHYVAPLAFRGDARTAMAALRAALARMPRAGVMREEAQYLHAEFRSRLFGFVDDVEFAYDASASAFHVRSASRLGYSDFGVNRARVEVLRALLAA